MLFLIFRQMPNGNIQKIGEALYLEDAKSMLNNWHSGFINRRTGETVLEKNLIQKKEN